uniref:Putative odorant receptor n=1 Tax=Anopheles darlingi TaxID=43151 RepID=A0A2M4CWL7_ANODA
MFVPSDEKAVMPLILRLLEVIGVWGDRKNRYRYMVVFLSYCLGILVPKVCFGYPSLEATIRGYAELILETNVFGGMLMFYLRNDHFEMLIQELRHLVVIVFRDYQSVVIQNYLIALNRRLHKYTLFFCFYMIGVCTVYCIAPLWPSYASYFRAINTPNHTTMNFNLHLEQGFYWLDNRSSIGGYSVFTAFMLPLMYACAYTGTVKVLAIFNSIKYCETVLRLVVLKVEQLPDLPTERQRLEAVSEARELHQRALRCAELLELVLQPALLTQFVLCIQIWCAMMLYFTVSGVNVKLLNMFLLFLFVSIETLGYCYLGTKLSDESINVGQAVYGIEWYTFNCRMQRNIGFMMMRSQRRVGVTAAKFCFVDMEQFGALDDDRAVLPLLLFLQGQWGFCQDTKRFRYLIFFIMYIFVMAIPKLSFGYRNQNELISSMAELIFVSNIVCGTMMLWLQYPRFVKFIDSLRTMAKLVYQDRPFSTSMEYLSGFNRRIHRSINTYCFCVMWLILFYVLAPIGTSFWMYITTQLSSAVNGTTEERMPIEFRHHMDHSFYGLQHNTYWPHYLIFTACMTPTALGVAFTVHMKVLTISSCVSYCEVLLHIVSIKIGNLAQVPLEHIHSELAHIIHLHERSLHCIAELKVILQPIMLLQFVLCVLTWCAFMLYFVVVVRSRRADFTRTIMDSKRVFSPNRGIWM